MPRLAKSSLLLFFFSLCGAAVFVTHQVQEHRAAPVPRELFGVVHDQLTALRASDFPGAYRYAATGVQQKFTLTQFEAMVRHNYGEMTRALRVEYGSVQVQGNAAAVQVFFFAADGSVRSLLYSLVSEGNRWKINGVEELGSYPRGVPLSGVHV